jgi:hypothetical protein
MSVDIALAKLDPASLWLCVGTTKPREELQNENAYRCRRINAARHRSTGSIHRTYGTGSNPSSHSVQGHTTSSGTYVQPYVATNPNSTQRDNFGATGNVNPYTGAVGTRNPRY